MIWKHFLFWINAWLAHLLGNSYNSTKFLSYLHQFKFTFMRIQRSLLHIPLHSTRVVKYMMQYSMILDILQYLMKHLFVTQKYHIIYQKMGDTTLDRHLLWVWQLLALQKNLPKLVKQRVSNILVGKLIPIGPRFSNVDK